MTALLDIVEHIYDCIEDGRRVTGVFLDLSEAFDSHLVS